MQSWTIKHHIARESFKTTSKFGATNQAYNRFHKPNIQQLLQPQYGSLNARYAGPRWRRYVFRHVLNVNVIHLAV